MRDARRHQPVADTQLAVDVLEVLVDRPGRDAEPVPDGRGGEALVEQLQGRQLAAGEVEAVTRVRRPLGQDVGLPHEEGEQRLQAAGERQVLVREVVTGAGHHEGPDPVGPGRAGDRELLLVAVRLQEVLHHLAAAAGQHLVRHASDRHRRRGAGEQLPPQEGVLVDVPHEVRHELGGRPVGRGAVEGDTELPAGADAVPADGPLERRAQQAHERAVRELAAGSAYELDDRVEPGGEAAFECVHRRLPCCRHRRAAEETPSRDPARPFEATRVPPAPHPPWR